MKTFKLFWDLHKWTGICVAVVLACTAVTGFMLLIKKRVEWIQPPTQVGAAGEAADFLPMDEMFEVVWKSGHEDFQSLDDIDRVDFRPGKRVYKVRSKHNHSEIQVCAVTGDILSVSWRPSDLFEQIHDGSFFGGWAHDWLMPVVSVALLFLVFSGLWLWIEPILRRRARRRRAASSARAP